MVWICCKFAGDGNHAGQSEEVGNGDRVIYRNDLRLLKGT